MKKPTFPRPRRYLSFGEKFGRDTDFFGSRTRREPPALGSWPLVPLCALGAILLCVLFALLAQLWKVSEVTAEDGELYTADVLLDHLDVEVGDTMVGFDTFAAERRLKEALPLLDKVQVKKYPNGKVSVKTSEVTDLYYTRHNVNYYIIDAADQRVICSMSTADEARRVGAVYIGFPENARIRVGETVSFINLPYAPESQPQEWTTYEAETDEPEVEYAYVYDFLERLMDSALADRVRGMELSDRYDIYIILTGGIKIRIGSMSELERKFRNADRMLADKEAAGEISEEMPILVDVSDPTRNTWRMAPDIVLPEWA